MTLSARAEPREEFSGRKRYFQSTLEDKVDERRDARRDDERDRPALASAELEGEERAQRAAEREAEQPDRSEVADDPAKNFSGATRHDIRRNSCIHLRDPVGQPVLPRQLHHEQDGGERQDRYADGPGEQPGAEAEVAALPERGGEDDDNQNRKSDAPARARRRRHGHGRR